MARAKGRADRRQQQQDAGARQRVVQVLTPDGRVLPSGEKPGALEELVRSLLVAFRSVWLSFPAGAVLVEIDADPAADVPPAEKARLRARLGDRVGDLLSAGDRPVELVAFEPPQADLSPFRVVARFVPAPAAPATQAAHTAPNIPLDPAAPGVQDAGGDGRPRGVADEVGQGEQDTWQGREQRRRAATAPISLAEVEQVEAVVARLRQDGVDSINRLLAELAGRAAASPGENKQVADRLNKLAKSVGAAILADGRPARISWNTGVFVAAAAAKFPEHIKSGKTLMELVAATQDQSQGEAAAAAPRPGGEPPPPPPASPGRA